MPKVKLEKAYRFAGVVYGPSPDEAIEVPDAVAQVVAAVASQQRELDNAADTAQEAGSGVVDATATDAQVQNPAPSDERETRRSRSKT